MSSTTNASNPAPKEVSVEDKERAEKLKAEANEHFKSKNLGFLKLKKCPMLLSM